MPLSRRWGHADDPYRAAALVNDKGRVVISTARMFPPKQSLASRAKAALARRLKSRSVGSKPNGAKQPNGSKRK